MRAISGSHFLFRYKEFISAISFQDDCSRNFATSACIFWNSGENW